MLNTISDLSLFEFQTAEEVDTWRIVNDGVMGGLSQSKVHWNEENKTLEFSGNVSMENNGGFASIRTAPRDFKKGKFKTIHLRVRGDGKIYKLRLRNSNRFDDISYSKDFQTKKNEWQELEMHVNDFEPTFRGRVYNEYPNFDTNELRQVGFLIADKQEGAFHLEVDWIRVIQ